MREKERAQALHERATKAVKMHTWSEKELVIVFAELDRFKGYRHFGAANLYQYAMKVQKLSESVALNIINIARKSNEVPEIRKAVVEGTISMSAARKIVPVITKDTAEAWIDLAATRSVRQVEKAVAEVKPQLAVRESARFVAKNRLEVILSLGEETFEKLERVMDLESQRTKSASSKGEAVAAALDAYLEKHDPLLKAKRARLRAEKKAAVDNAPAPVTGQVNPRQRTARTSRKHVYSVLRHAIDLRDGRQCTHVDIDGVRCEERRWLDYHHVIPVERGGKDTLDNIITLCGGHHRMEHHGSSAVRERWVVYH